MWMGVAPPETITVPGSEKRIVPGYACVIGEVFERNPLQNEPLRVLFDEGVALDPRDFEGMPGAREQYGLCESLEDAIKHPTLHALRQAMVALKDLWLVERILVPPDNDQFFEYVRQTEGLYFYDNRVPDYRFRRSMPFFRSRHRTCHGILKGGMVSMDANGQGVFKEDREWNDHVTQTLLNTRRFNAVNECGIFWEEHGPRPPTARRAVGLVLNEMQYYDMTFQVRDYHVTDGYDREPDPEEEEARQEETQQHRGFMAWWGGKTTREDDLSGWNQE